MSVEFDSRPFWKPRDLASMLSVSPSAIYRLIEDGTLEHVKVGERTVRVRGASVAAHFGFDTPAARPSAMRGSEDLEGQAKAFEQRTGRTAEEFVEAWRHEAIPDSADNNSLALEALALREAFARRGSAVAV